MDDQRVDLKGTYEHLLDVKGRLTLPVPLREQLMHGGAPTFSLALDSRNIVLMPPATWRQFVDRLNALRRTDEKAERVRRFILSEAFDCHMDEQGRALVPPKLRGFAGIGREVTLAGRGDAVEIWDRAAWRAYIREGRESLVADARELDL